MVLDDAKPYGVAIYESLFWEASLKDDMRLSKDLKEASSQAHIWSRGVLGGPRQEHSAPSEE